MKPESVRLADASPDALPESVAEASLKTGSAPKNEPQQCSNP